MAQTCQRPARNIASRSAKKEPRQEVQSMKASLNRIVLVELASQSTATQNLLGHKLRQVPGTTRYPDVLRELRWLVTKTANRGAVCKSDQPVILRESFGARFDRRKSITCAARKLSQSRWARWGLEAPICLVCECGIRCWTSPVRPRPSALANCSLSAVKSCSSTDIASSRASWAHCCSTWRLVPSSSMILRCTL